MIRNDRPRQHALPSEPRIVASGGGYPIQKGGPLIGAIGVSGGCTSDDLAVARAGRTAIGAPVS